MYSFVKGILSTVCCVFGMADGIFFVSVAKLEDALDLSPGFTQEMRIRLPHTVRCSCSPKDKAHDYGSCICRFESCQELKIWSVGREADCNGLLIRRSDTDPEVRILHTSLYMLQLLRWWSRGPENRQSGRVCRFGSCLQRCVN